MDEFGGIVAIMATATAVVFIIIIVLLISSVFVIYHVHRWDELSQLTKSNEPKKSTIAAILLTMFTLGFYQAYLVWKLSERIAEVGKKRKIDVWLDGKKGGGVALVSPILNVLSMVGINISLLGFLSEIALVFFVSNDMSKIRSSYNN